MIDWHRVRELRSEVGAEDFDEVAALFLEEVAEVVTRLRQATDPERLQADLHFMKGSALNLGFASFAAQCMEGEQAAAAGRAAEVDVAALLDCYDDSRLAFLEGLNRLPAD